MRSDKVFHVISNTHWDREWRFPFQRNRQMLVEMMDNVLDILCREPEYRAFHLDSQSIVLDDYLEIKPQNKELIKKFVKEKRLLIGPWYILPDEFQVGGENLIRNLLLGHKVCSEFGGASKTGYSPFSWGQISQLPQIYAGFGVDVIMFYRGVNSLESKKAEFLWEGADGTTALTSRFSTMPRYNFYFYIYRRVVHNEDFSDVESEWEKGLPFHAADTDIKEDYYNINHGNTYHKENIKKAVEEIINDQADDFTTAHVIWMEGHDSSGPDIRTVDIIRDIKKTFPGIDVRHSTLEEYASLLKKSADYKKLVHVKGERRSSQFDRRSGNLYGYTTSARMDIKILNFNAERWLQYYSEPFSTIVSLITENSEDKYLDKAWNFLIQNSAHDSIGGCSLDQIHDDMRWRYKQVINISQGVFFDSLKTIIKNIDLQSDSGINIVVFNPLPFCRNEICDIYIDIPVPSDKGDFRIVSSPGEEIKFVVIENYPAEPVLEQLVNRPMYYKMMRYKCKAEFRDIPALGYKTFSVIPCKKLKSKSAKIARYINGLPVLENDLLKVSVNRNGTINIFNKKENIIVEKTGYIYDEGEAGHAWVHKPVKPFINTLNSRPEIKIISNDELSAVCSVRYNLNIPLNLTERKKKKGKTVRQKIEVNISLYKDSQRLDYFINTENIAESHRLRIMFPAGFESDYSYGEGQFDVVRRNTDRPDTSDWIEQPMYDYPMHHFADLSDGEKGLAVLVDGLKEYEILQDKKTIAVTLLRCFEYVIQPSSVENYPHMKGSQCPGLHDFRLSLFLHKSGWREGKVFPEALKFNYGCRTVQTGNNKGNLKSTCSFIELSSQEIVMSCLKPSEDGTGIIMRLYNPGETDAMTLVNFFKPVKKSELVSLEEIFLRKLNPDKNKLMLRFKPKQILTVKLEF